MAEGACAVSFEQWRDWPEDPAQRERFVEIFAWIEKTFPKLDPVIKWNQPMYTDHGTFIVGFSTAKQNLAFMPEAYTLKQFVDEVEKAGYTHTDNLVRVRFDQKMNYSLLKKMIAFQIKDKVDTTSFWRLHR